MHSCVRRFLQKFSANTTKKQEGFFHKTPVFDEFGKTFNNYMPQLDKGAGSYYNIVYIYAYIIQNIHFLWIFMHFAEKKEKIPMAKVFIDGSAGTTGLRIYERLAERKDLELITLSEEHRKENAYRAEALSKADIAFLCLPDAAAVEAVALAEGSAVKIIDTSTAHRTNSAWAYGFPELDGQRDKILSSTRIANPGCHASGFIALMAPLVWAGIVKADANLSCFSLTGYSGGGKKMIAEYEDAGRNVLLDAPRQYGLTQKHKHLPEMKKVCGLTADPAFCPIVAPYYAGMEVTVPLFASELSGNVKEICDVYRAYYKEGLVRFVDSGDEEGFLSANAFAGRDDMQITVCGNEERILLVSRFDNLGKGASGAAIQNMNILLGVPEETGLNV